MSLRYEVLSWGEQMLRSRKISDWKMDAWLLYEFVTGMSRTEFLMGNSEFMPEQEIQQYEHVIDKRCGHIPVQHIIGRQEFMGLEFYVNEHVLVPRMDTEVLVETVEKHVKNGQSILDMCTGSGCIAISLKKRNDSLKVTAADISLQALDVAKRNCENLQADIQLDCSDLFEIYKQSEQLKQFDGIVSNPPYIPSAVVDCLEPEVRDHEPRLALDGTEDGLAFYKKITQECKPFLKAGGMLFYEIGHDQARAVSRIMEAEGFVDVTVVQDLAGLDRVVYGGFGNV